MLRLKKSWIFYFFTFYLLFLDTDSYSQINKYLIYFSDKNNSPYSLNNPSQFLSPRSVERRTKQGIQLSSRDLPVNPTYVDSIKNIGSQVLYTSRWFNAALVLADSLQMVSIKSFAFVKKLSSIKRIAIASNNGSQSSKDISSTQNYGSSLNQVSMIGADVMHAQGFHGEGIQIAILDAGFKNANSLFFLDSLFYNNQILSTYDFVSNNSNVYDDDEHGTMVLSVLGGYASGQLIGTAYKADFYLLRTEDAGSESLIEEFNWLLGAEYADSAGADIINSSLGYNTFDDPTTNHTYSDLDGKTTIITQAANMAASSGMLVVNSAGNEGTDFWKYIIAPADSDSILAIGATNSSGAYVSFSSQGPSASGHIKPDLAAKGFGTTVGGSGNSITYGNGTSFACPLVAGLSAGVWQAYPGITAMELKELLKKSGSQDCHPDNYLGYGIPDFMRVQQIMGTTAYDSKTYIYPTFFEGESFTLILNPEYKGKEVKVRMFDLSGKIIDDQMIPNACFNNNLSLHTFGLSQGMYLIQIIVESKIFTFKIMKF